MSWLISDVHLRSLLCQEPSRDPKLHKKVISHTLQYNSSLKPKCSLPQQGPSATGRGEEMASE